MKELGRVGILVAATIVPALDCSNSPTPNGTSVQRVLDPGTSAASTSTGRGSLEGEVLFRGSDPPRSTRVRNTTDPSGCGPSQSLENILISGQNSGIQNVIVSLEGVPPSAHGPVPTSRLLLENRDCRFQPHAGVLTTGSAIEAVNRDAVFHSVHLYGPRNLNLALGPGQSKQVRVVKHAGLIVVKCDVHGWMQAFFRVDEHPYHSVSDVHGGFRIENIPSGSYRLEAWHEYFGRQQTAVTIPPGTVSRVTLYYGEKPRFAK
ncbi:MAG: carboxypeptidase regulatory-like domain-containing protein [Acidobacteriota bacterium]